MSTSLVTTHPLVACARTVREALGEVRDVQPIYMSTADREAALREFAAAEAALVEARLRVLAASADVAAEAGARDAGVWLAHETRADARSAHADLELAHALDRTPVLAEALAQGRVNAAQARVITEAVADLPAHLGADVADRATASLIGFAADHGPRDLRRLGRRILDVVAPEVADEEDAARLEAEEERARAKASIRVRADVEGMSCAALRLPTPLMQRFVTYLDAFLNPRRPTEEVSGLGAWAELPLHRRRAFAFEALLELLDPAALPERGGVTTTVLVSLGLDELRSGVGVATLQGLDDVEISAAEARRLACEAGFLPVVLGGSSQILDAGRMRRLFTGIQRLLIQARYGTCVAEGCTVPATWSQIHHLDPFGKGGRTDIADGVPVCVPHHRMFESSRWTPEFLESGRVRFHRRT